MDKLFARRIQYLFGLTIGGALIWLFVYRTRPIVFITFILIGLGIFSLYYDVLKPIWRMREEASNKAKE